MRAVHISSVLVGTTLAMALTACGPGGSDTAKPTEGGDAGESTSASRSPRGDKKEKITPGGIAMIVRDHVGRSAIEQFATYEPEPGTVSVMITLRDDGPHNFAVQVHSPKYAAQLGKAGQCPPKPKGQRATQMRCRTLESGTTIMMIEDSAGFSDDNAKGMVLSGTAITAGDGAALAMYEIYDKSPAVSSADIEDLLSDPRLTWLTEVAVNEAGEDVAVKRING
jgi:hypothetical protein